MTTKPLNRSHIVRAAWSHARLIADTLGQPIRAFIGATMRTAWALAKGLMPAPIADMVPQPVQQQQACAAPTKAVSPVVTAMAEVERLEAKCAKLRDEKRAAFALVSECRKERIAAVAGEIDACPGVCWTNEERAEAAADEATAALDRCLNDYWEACDYLRDEEREERRASLKARIATGPAMVPTPCQQQQANAGAIPPAPETQPEILSDFQVELRERALTKAFDLAVHKANVLREVYTETSTRYWESRRNKGPNARLSKQEAHDRHVSDEMDKRCDAALVEMNAAFDALEGFLRQQGTKIEPLLKVAQPAQQQQARDLRPPEPREIRVAALGHQGHSCDPESPEASLWIVTDGRLSRDCASHREALDLAEDFRVWGYVVPAL